MSYYACLGDPEALRYIIHHVFLPPGLPSGDDYDAALDSALIECVCKALKTFQEKIPQESHPAVDVASAMINKLRRSRDPDGSVCESSLLQLLQELQPGKFINYKHFPTMSNLIRQAISSRYI